MNLRIACLLAIIFICRFGFDGNHFSAESLCKNNNGHFGCENHFVTDEVGNFHPGCMFGSNDIALISNNPLHGNNSHGVVIQGADDGSDVDLPINVNGASTVHGAGCTLILVTGFESGTGDAKVVSALYMVRSGHKEDHAQASVVHGDDKWKFVAKCGGRLSGSGPSRSVYGIYHNRDNLDYDDGKVVISGHATACHSQSLSGDEETVILKGIRGKFAAAVLCSNGSGSENNTRAAVYLLIVKEDEVVKSVIKTSNAGDVWKFKVKQDTVVAHGGTGPTRYGVISNLPSKAMSNSLLTSAFCLATGEDRPVQGAVSITKEEVTGWISKPSDVVITINERVVAKYASNQLKKISEKFAFSRSFGPNEKKPGLYLVRSFAIRKHTKGKYTLTCFYYYLSDELIY